VVADFVSQPAALLVFVHISNAIYFLVQEVYPRRISHRTAPTYLSRPTDKLKQICRWPALHRNPETEAAAILRTSKKDFLWLIFPRFVATGRSSPGIFEPMRDSPVGKKHGRHHQSLQFRHQVNCL
jgi:hypothetical protein